MELTKILQSKVHAKIMQESSHNLLRGASYNNIIHINEHEYRYSPFVVEKQRCISLESRKTK
jgi:hypothetical protein